MKDWNDVFNSLVTDIYFDHNKALGCLEEYKCPKCNRSYAEVVAANEDLVVVYDGREPLCETCYKEEREFYKKRKDCYFCSEFQEMNATVLNCSYDLTYAYGYCPCSAKCPNYVSDDKVRDLVMSYLETKSKSNT